jgi:hypothetical protein
MKTDRFSWVESGSKHLLLPVFFALTLAFSPGESVRADFMLLSLSLGTAQHISANQVAFDIDVLFWGSETVVNTDYINAFTFTLDSTNTSVELKSGAMQDYDRFSFDTFRSGWDGGIDRQFGSGGFSTLSQPVDPVDDTIHYGSTPVTLARMVIDTSGLTPGLTYNVSLFNPVASDATGIINGSRVDSLVADFPGSVQLNASSSFTITAVPEPSSIMYGVAAGTFGLVMRRRRKLKARVRNR